MEALAVSIVVDTNAGEDELYSRLCAQKELAACTFSRKRLEVGDVSIVAGERTVIVERKTWDDLCASVRDGRYKEQKARQMKAVADDENGGTLVVYLVVGSLLHWHALSGSMRNGHVESALLATAVRDRIPVLRARDAGDGAEMIACLARRARDGELDGAAQAQKGLAQGYASFVRSTNKRRNMTDDVVWQSMLASVPGVSSAKAACIAAAFPTARHLVEALRHDPKGVKRLAELQAGSKKLGPAVAKRLYSSLIGEGASP